MKLLVFLLLFSVVASHSQTGFSQDATGTFVVKGGSTQFRHVYAFWKDQQPFRSGLDLYVLLSDVAVAENVIPKNDEANSRMSELVRSDKIHALELHFTDPGKTLNDAEQGAVYNNGVAPARHGLSGILKYQAANLEGETIGGKVSMDPDALDHLGFKIDASFKVTIPPKK